MNGGCQQEGRMPRVLVVDDDPRVVATLSDVLRLKGYTVDIASDGPEALERVREARPHVVLLDVSLPTMNGLEVLLCIRQLDPTVGVIMVSGICDEVTIRRALTLGAAEYLVKPMKLQELERTLEHALKNSLTMTPPEASLI
jgi:DNA-binding response OmpR family regulator